ncbi:MAG: hypothetical protein ABIJ48_08930 [Actinomycetota bacterium]
MRPTRVAAAVTALLMLCAACSGSSQPATTTAITSTTALTTTSGATPATATTVPPTTSTLPTPPPLLGEPWGDLPPVDVALAREGGLMIAGPEGVMLVRDGEPLGLLQDGPTQAAAPDGIGGVVYQTPFRVEDAGDNDVWWLPGTGGREYVGIRHTPLGSFRLQEVDWVPRLGRYEDGAWTPTYNGLTAFFADSEHQTTGVLVTTGDPLRPADHWEIYLPGAPGAGGTWHPTNPAARAWTGRHLAEAVYGAEGTRLEFRRVDGTTDVLPHNPVPEYIDGWIANLDAEPGPSLLAYTVASTKQQFGVTTNLRVVDLTAGGEVLAVPIGGEDQQVVRLDLHDGTIAVSTRAQVPGGITLDLVRLVDLATGTVTPLPWGGTASFFHVAEALPVAPYPAAAPGVPELVITAPIEGTVVTESAVRFEGYATPGADVMAAGRYPVAVDAAGHWSTTLTLNPGGNVAVFAAAFPGGPAAETARVLFRATGPEMGYTLAVHYERGDEPTWVTTVWVYDRVTRQRLAGVGVALKLTDSWREEPPIALVTGELGTVVLRSPIGADGTLACVMGLELGGYLPPPAYPYSDLPPGSIGCEWTSFP